MPGKSQNVSQNWTKGREMSENVAFSIQTNHLKT